MSIQTWMGEFFPIPQPIDTASMNMTWEQACQHSLQKWTGLRPENLQKHHVILRPEVLDGSRPPLCVVSEMHAEKENLFDVEHKLEICGESCALCFKSEQIANDINEEIDEEIESDEEDETSPMFMCEACPLKFTLSLPCDGVLESDIELGWQEEGEGEKEEFKEYLKQRDKRRSESPYGIFLATKNPEPMIKALEDTLKMLRENSKDFFVHITLKKGFLHKDIAPSLTLEDFKFDEGRFITLEKERFKKKLELYLKRIEKEKDALKRYESEGRAEWTKLSQSSIDRYQKAIDQIQNELDDIRDIEQSGE